MVAIAGPPNAGKSSLFNRLVRRDAAIVTPIPGTTRDVIEVHLDFDGYPVTLLDTAGIRPTQDPVEQEGVRRAEARAAAADLVLWVTDATDSAGSDSAAAEGRSEAPLWIDSEQDRPPRFGLGTTCAKRIWVSALRGMGVDRPDRQTRGACGGDLRIHRRRLVTRERHRRALEDTVAALSRGPRRKVRHERISWPRSFAWQPGLWVV